MEICIVVESLKSLGCCRKLGKFKLLWKVGDAVGSLESLGCCGKFGLLWKVWVAVRENSVKC